MRRISGWLLGVSILTEVTCGGRAWSQDPKGPTAAELPFKLYGGYLIVVEGQIDGVRGLKFALDTGATHTIVDSRAANAVVGSATKRSSGRVVSVDRVVKTESVQVPELGFGPVEVHDLSVVVGDLRYLESATTHVDAMIGLDVLRRRNFSIDYRRKIVSWEPAQPAPNEVPMEPDPNCLTVKLQAGDQEVRAIVDTGVQGLVLYEDLLTERGIKYRVQEEVTGMSLGGQVRSKVAVLQRLRLGKRDLSRSVVLTESPGGRFLQGVNGFFGPVSLRAQRVDFDFEKNTLSWE